MPCLAPPTPKAAPDETRATPVVYPPLARRSPRIRGGFSSRWLAIGLWLAGPALAAERPAPGAYCPLPEPGQQPVCLDPAKQAYGEFFEALDAGEVREEPLDAMEAVVAEGAASEEAYLALSSLTYGYYRLALQAASAEDADPEIVARLSRWNTLLASAYRENESDADYRGAVARAATELRERAPVRLPCRDAEGREAACTSTEAVIRGFNQTAEQVGFRGALERLLQRWFGGSS